MAAKKTAKMTKAAFVRSLPVTTPAKEVVSKAKEAGIDLTDGYVYNVRATSKGPKKKGSPGRPKGSKNKTTMAAAPAARRSGSAEDLLRAVASELGLGRAIDILQAQRQQVRAVLGG